jgi:hypothetical protein
MIESSSAWNILGGYFSRIAQSNQTMREKGDDQWVGVLMRMGCFSYLSNNDCITMWSPSTTILELGGWENLKRLCQKSWYCCWHSSKFLLIFCWFFKGWRGDWISKYAVKYFPSKGGPKITPKFQLWAEEIEDDEDQWRNRRMERVAEKGLTTNLFQLWWSRYWKYARTEVWGTSP